MTGPGVAAIRRRLLRWYDRNRRDLPWRRTSDPYAIWVSEVMLQQTRVAAVVPYYRRFLERFPTIGALAAADEEQVLAAWSGLGYYRRARALHAAARYLVDAHGGELPRETEVLLRIPGIGRYTAGAIASVAFGRAEPVVDGNVRRVLSRLFAVDGRALGRAAEDREMWRLAGLLVVGRRPGDLNQALMELGATTCLPTAPGCAGCPLAGGCAAHARGEIDRYPRSVPRHAPVDRRVAVALVRRNGRVLLERPGGSSPFRGTWDLPAAVVPTEGGGATRLRRELRERHGLTVEVGEPVARYTHGILDQRLQVDVHAGRLVAKPAARTDCLRWVRSARIDDVAVSAATRKALQRSGSGRRNA